MRHVMRTIWPLILALALFTGVSLAVRTQLDVMAGILAGSSDAYGMLLYMALGIVSVIVPFGSLVPFMPVAVALWGWPLTALLSGVAWVIGGQLLFEFARRFGKPFVTKVIPKSQLKRIGAMADHSGFFKKILVRWFVHGDIVSYGCGLFTRMSRREFLLLSIVGVMPSAVLCAYFGSLTVSYQIAIGSLAIVCFGVYLLVQAKYPRLTRHGGWKLKEA